MGLQKRKLLKYIKKSYEECNQSRKWMNYNKKIMYSDLPCLKQPFDLRVASSVKFGKKISQAVYQQKTRKEDSETTRS